MNAISQPERPRAGRPTREQAEARMAQLLDCAIGHFLNLGFEKTTIEAIAADVGMTKRTVYARFPDKTALFKAALRKAIEDYAVPPERIRANLAGTLEQTLINIARMRIERISQERGMKLQRLVETEAYRFPDIFGMSYELGAKPTVEFLAGLLEEECARGELRLDDPALAANIFMSMVVSGPVRFILSGNAMPEAEIHERVAFAVRLFLEGSRPR